MAPEPFAPFGGAPEPTPEHLAEVEELGVTLSQLSQRREDSLEIQRAERGVRSQVLYNELYVAEQHNTLVRGVMRYLRTFNPQGQIELAQPESSQEAEILVPVGLGALVLTKDGFRIKVEPTAYNILEDVSTSVFNFIGSAAKSLVPSVKFEPSDKLLRTVGVSDLRYFPIDFEAVAAPIKIYADSIVKNSAPSPSP